MIDLFVPDIIDCYILAGSYSDSDKFVNGESCKALVPYPEKDDPTFLYYTTSSFGNLREIRNIMINGPSRLEKEIERYEDSIKKRIDLIEETKPGDLTQGLEDCFNNFKERYSDLTDYVLVISTDFTKMNNIRARIIYNKLATEILEDIDKERSPRDIYFAVGNQIDDNSEYSRIREYKLDRKGIVISAAESLRWVGAALIKKEIINTKEDEIQEIIKHHGQRKVAGNWISATKYWVKKIYEKKGHSWLKSVSIIKLLYNTLKREIAEKSPFIDYLIPYSTLHLKDANTIISETMGLDFCFVRTPGSADIDNNEEFKSAAEKLNKSKKKFKKLNY